MKNQKPKPRSSGINVEYRMNCRSCPRWRVAASSKELIVKALDAGWTRKGDHWCCYSCNETGMPVTN